MNTKIVLIIEPHWESIENLAGKPTVEELRKIKFPFVTKVVEGYDNLVEIYTKKHQEWDLSWYEHCFIESLNFKYLL